MNIISDQNLNVYKLGERTFQIGEIQIESDYFLNLVKLLDRGSKFIPCIHFNEFDMFKFILENFDNNFNVFNSRLNMTQKKFSKSNLIDSISTNVSSHFNLLKCFSEKCKILKNNFKNMSQPLSKDSIEFKFNFYKKFFDIK